MKVWFITGASRGFGALIAERALAQGDAVVASARNPATVDLGSGDPIAAGLLDDGLVVLDGEKIVVTERGPDHWGRYRDRYVCLDGRWLFAYISRGWNENDIYVRDLKNKKETADEFGLDRVTYARADGEVVTTGPYTRPDIIE
mgnify:CR=1 FL=1